MALVFVFVFEFVFVYLDHGPKSGGHLMALASPPCWWTSDGTAGLEKDQMLLRRIYSLQI